MARRNTYREDEVLETPFDFHHLLRASVYIKKYLGGMILAFVLSAIGGIADSYMAKSKARSLDAKLAKATKWLGAVFVVLTLVLNCMIAAGK